MFNCFKFFVLLLLTTLFSGCSLAPKTGSNPGAPVIDPVIFQSLNQPSLPPILGLNRGQTLNELSSPPQRAAFRVISASLTGVYDQGQGQNQVPKLKGLRVVGEIKNIGAKSGQPKAPVVRFHKEDGLVQSKLAVLNLEIPVLDSGEVFPYDVVTDDPPPSNSIEISFENSEENGAEWRRLKILDRKEEEKEASGSGQIVKYREVHGSVYNTNEDKVLDAIVYAYARDKEGRVYAVGRRDFKNDLLSKDEKLDFNLIILPLREAEYDSLEIAAWGKKY